LTEGNTCTLSSTKVNLKSFILSEGPLQSNIRILTVCIQKTGNRKLLAFIKLSITSSWHKEKAVKFPALYLQSFPYIIVNTFLFLYLFLVILADISPRHFHTLACALHVWPQCYMKVDFLICRPY
jgi:hypothetical protein